MEVQNYRKKEALLTTYTLGFNIINWWVFISD